MLSQQVGLPGVPAWNTSIWQTFESPQDAWSWSNSVLEQSLLQALGMPREQDTSSTGAEMMPPPAPVTVPTMSNADQPGFNTLPASTRFGNDAFDSFAPLSPAAAAVQPPAAPTANDDFSGFGGFASPPAAAATVVPPAASVAGDDFGGFGDFASPPAVAAAAKPPAASVAGDDFGGFGDFASPPAVAAAAKPPAASVAGDDFGGFGGFDSFSSAATTAPNMPNMPPGAQLGTAGKYGSLDPSPTPAAASSSWVAKLPNLAFVLNEKLDRPSM